MRPYLTVIFSSFYFLVFSQSFGTIGTEWEHCIIPIFEIPLSYDKVIVKSVSSFSMNQLECNELEIMDKPNTMQTLDKISICRDGDRVFYKEADSLFLLYDFSLGIGTSYIVRYPILFDTTFQHNFPNESIYTLVTIDSVVIVNINGVDLRRQYISTQGVPFLKFGNYALERVGYENWVLPFYSFDASELNTFVGLLNYKDDAMEIHEDSANCNLSSVSNTKNEQIVEIYPNPSTSSITIMLNAVPIELIEIISMDGILVKRMDLNGNQTINVELNSLPKGIYLAKFKGIEHPFSKRFVIR